MKFPKAFSLIELSVVILIIGIVMAGIAKTGSFVKKSRLQTARVLTQKSPVNDISDLMLWYETSSESSFNNSERSDGSTVSVWHDNNSDNTIKNSAVQTASANQPIFYENVFNAAIPGVRFDGVNDFMTFDGSLLANNSYTIFVVEQRRSNANSNYFFGGTATAANSNLFLGYRSDTTMTQAHYSNDMNYSGITTYSSPTPRIHTFAFNISSLANTKGKRYWLNGSGASSTTKASDNTQTSPISSYSGSALGRYIANYFNGDLAEIIIFTRNLTDNERLSIEDYLGKKYNISVTTN